MLEVIARAVREARAQLGMNPATLAARAQLGVDRLVALEAARPGVTLDELDQIADALQLDRDALADGRAVARPRPSTFFRQSAWQDFHHEDADALDAILEQSRAFLALGTAMKVKRQLRLQGVFEPRAVTTEGHAAAAHEGYALAGSVRDRLGAAFRARPLGDLRVLLEGRFDLIVRVATLRSAVPALSILDADRRAAAIVLNARDPQRRSNPVLDRVHLAHELCHVLFDETEPGQLHLVLERDDLDGDHAEARAKGFAAEFLLPLEGLRLLLGPKPQRVRDPVRAVAMIQQARAHFGTPWELATRHLGNRRYLDRDLAESLAEHPQGEAPKGFDTLVPEADAAPRILVDRVRRAWKDLRILSDGQARNALGLPPGSALPFSP
jgi:transcriptional regulator with XRE-family HTH domain